MKDNNGDTTSAEQEAARAADEAARLRAAEEQGGSEQLPAVEQDVDPFADAFAGQENVGGADVLVPRLKLMQALSPETKKQRPEYVPGIEEGDFFNSATRRFYKGSEGVLLIPCFYTKRWLEWTPRGQGDGGRNQGPVAEHDESIMQQTKEDEKGRPRLENGNLIAITPEFYCMLVTPEGLPERIVVGMPGSKSRIARQWNTLIRARVAEHPRTKQLVVMPSFFGAYRMTSVATSNQEGDFFVPAITFDKPVQDLPHGASLYLAAREFYTQAKAGMVKAAAEHDDGTEGAGGGESAGRRAARGDNLPF